MGEYNSDDLYGQVPLVELAYRFINIWFYPNVKTGKRNQILYKYCLYLDTKVGNDFIVAKIESQSEWRVLEELNGLKEVRLATFAMYKDPIAWEFA